MQRLTIEYSDGCYAPKDLCSIDRNGDADGCDACGEHCQMAEDGTVDCAEYVIGVIDQCFDRLGIYENAHEKIEKRLQEIKGSTEYPHNFTLQMAENLEWVLRLFAEDSDCSTGKGAENEA